MTLLSKEKPEDICEHLKEVIKVMISNNITMNHDYEGTSLHCSECDSSIWLEAYDEKFTDTDILED